jgi:hypothetical protein
MIDDIISDLELLFQRESITGEEFESFLKELKSEDVKNYLIFLRDGSKPEQALKDVFFSHGSEFVKLFGRAEPEVFRVKTGFIDYIIEKEGSKAVNLEIKPPFIVEFREEKGGKRLFKRIKKQELKPSKSDEQIRKYLRTEGEYLIFTNLETWCFFTESISREMTKPFSEMSFSEFLKDFQQIGDLYKFCDLKEENSIKEPLDEEFFKSLDIWVKQLKKVNYTVDDKTRNELIINLINKLIFIQCLDKLWVGPHKYIERNWSRLEDEWAGRKKEILNEFLKRADNYFYKIYDTELFREPDEKTIYDFIKKDKENIERFYKSLKLVLGIDVASWHIGWVNGIIQYNFRFIDEDILGKAYEKYLALIRKEEGIYYTPKYITQYIVENTVGIEFDELLRKIKKAFDKNDLDKADKLIDFFISIKVMDPACGSGSFLIKALRLIWEKYAQLNNILEEANENAKQNNAERADSNVFSKFEGNPIITELYKKIGFKNKRELISKIILRHIYGNDLDSRAVEVSKVNIWLEAIKLIPSEFRYDRLPHNTNHILPYLEMNLGNGDSVVGLPEDNTIQFLLDNNKSDLKKLFELRNQYLSDPTKEKSIEKIIEIKNNIRNKLNTEFKQYLKDKKLPQEISEKTNPFHWPLDFWYVYFNEDLTVLNKEDRGFEEVIGNPPYVRIQILKEHIPEYGPYLKSEFDTSHKNYDLAVIFTEKGYNLLKNNGRFAYIETKKWIKADYGEKLRELISSNECVEELIDFGDQQVFDEASTYTALVFLKKECLKNFKYALVHHLKEKLEQLNEIRDNNELTMKDFSVTIINSNEISSDNWVFYLPEEKPIRNKISNYPKLSDKANVFVGLQTSADPIYILEVVDEKKDVTNVYSKTTKKNYLLEKELLKPVLRGNEIRKWVIDSHNFVLIFPYEFDKDGSLNLIKKDSFETKYPKIFTYLKENKKKLTKRADVSQDQWWEYPYPKNLDEFEQKKILTQVLSNHASLALDNKGKYYFVGGGNAGGYGLTLKNETKLTLEYIMGLMNSSLLDWCLKKNSSRFMSGYYSYAKRYIEQLPIYEADEKEQKPIIETVNKIIVLKNLQEKFNKIWMEYSKKYRNNKKSLGEILLADKMNIRDGYFDQVWTSDSNIYPNGKNPLLEKEYIDFKILTEEDKGKIKVNGIFDSSEELVLELTVKDRELRAIIHLSILELMNSRSKVKTIKDIFSKTHIPVIQPNTYENSQNLIKGATKKFEEWRTKQNIKLKTKDVLYVENEIHELENQLDAYVFKLYGLDRNEIEIVLDKLGFNDSLKEDILHKFNEMEG